MNANLHYMIRNPQIGLETESILKGKSKESTPRNRLLKLSAKSAGHKMVTIFATKPQNVVQFKFGNKFDFTGIE